MSCLFAEFDTRAKLHKRPPLGFQGNKKNMISHFIKVLNYYENKGLITKDTIFVDVFGGSGLLSHHLKYRYPENRVIWNDFDDFKHRLDIAPITERIRQRLCEMFVNFGVLQNGKDDHLPTPLIAEIKAYLADFDESELDCVQLSQWLCFSGRYYNTKKELLRDDIKTIQYNQLSFTPIDTKGFLNGFERVQKDYKWLLVEFESNKNAFFVLDPPYLQTSEKAYTQHFRLTDFLNCVKVFIERRGVWFSSTRSHCFEFFEWYMNDKGLKNDIKTFKASLGNNKDTDILFYK